MLRGAVQPPMSHQHGDATPQQHHRDLHILPLKRRSLLNRLDVFPFILGYSILIALDCACLNNEWSSQKELPLMPAIVDILYLILLATQLVLFLKCQWDAEWRALVAFKKYTAVSLSMGVSGKIQEMKNWTHVLILPSQSSYGEGTSTVAPGETAGIVPVSIVKNSVTGSSNGGANDVTCYTAVVHFRGLTYRCCVNLFPEDEVIDEGKVHADLLMESIWDTQNSAAAYDKLKEINEDEDLLGSSGSNGNNSATKTTGKTSSKRCDSWEPQFLRLHFPIDLPLNFYFSWNGHDNKPGLETHSTTLQIYNRNVIHIPLPSILSLLLQQLLQPLFLFQLFCVILWSLDEYWMYALFTLFSLVMFELTMAYNRWKGVKNLREEVSVSGEIDDEDRERQHHHRTKSPLVECFRHGEWNTLPSNQLVVGDIISLVSPTMMQQRIPGHDHEQGNAIPADLLLLSGRAIVNESMLTGESKPQVKESIRGEVLDGGKANNANVLDVGAGHKRCVLFGGTVLLDHHSDGEDVIDESNASVPAPPNQGLTCFVLRTGFDTIQGSLLRSLAYRAESGGWNAGGGEGVNSRETFLFLALLLLFALISASTVVQHSWGDVTRNHFKLVLHVIIIVTSVIPPELPMELSLAVTTSLSELIKRCQVYCTEPFRIPLAGLVDTCCFDKTGTLTSDELRLHAVQINETGRAENGHSHVQVGDEGLILFDDIASKETSRNFIARESLRVMVGCQSLAVSHSFVTGRDGRTTVANKLVGDPLEKAVLDACSWTMLPGSKGIVVEIDKSSSTFSDSGSIRVLHRFAFSSTLRRMSVLAIDNQGTTSNTLWALTKGGPETIMPLLDPNSFDSIAYQQSYQRQMSLGRRVLALAYRNLGKNTAANVEKWKSSRDKVEQNLIFAGLLIMDSPLKADSRRIIKELRAGQQSTVMVTGDAVLTAVEVARRVGIIDSPEKSTYELRHSGEFRFVPLGSFNDTHKEQAFEYTPDDMYKLGTLVRKGKAAVCVTGDILQKVATTFIEKDTHRSATLIDKSAVLTHPAARKAIASLVPIVSVFARHEPRHKEAVIAAFNSLGRYTLMCGDGSNDIGALKAAHVGVSIISVPDLEGKQREAIDGIKAKTKTPKKSKDKKSKPAEVKQVESYFQALAEAEDELARVSLGNASVASPFTARKMSIKCCQDILQQGRCTLVTMIQIYKILGVNCLVTALVLTKLHQVGVKQGDRQMTVEGLVVAGLFLFVARGRPISKLSPQKPPSSILSTTTLFSMAAQFAVHFLAIMAVTHMSEAYIDPYDPSIIPDGPFVPNTLNTATFLITVLAMINTFAVNYQGRPFMEDLKENTLLFRSITLCYCVLLVCALDMFPPLNQLLQLTSLPSQKGLPLYTTHDFNILSDLINQASTLLGFRVTLLALMCADTACVICFEKVIRQWRSQKPKSG